MEVAEKVKVSVGGNTNVWVNLAKEKSFSACVGEKIFRRGPDAKFCGQGESLTEFSGKSVLQKGDNTENKK